ncbi:MAG: hypothetical protein GXO17_03200 [Thermodesulfobacteria bacterium]|nr:hypothetical protein [Thermodesulfobacteriota bacterium]
MHSANLKDTRQIRFYPEDPLPRGEIILLGTIHRAPILSSPLREILSKIRPRIITVEISPLSLRRRREKESQWLRQFDELSSRLPDHLARSPALSLFREALRLPYEWRVAEETASSLGIKAVPVDLNRFARPHLKTLEGLLTPAGVEEIARGLVNPLEKEWALAVLSLRNRLVSSSSEDARREEHVARRITLLRERPLVHICGWRHLPGLMKLLPRAEGVFFSPPQKFK